MQHMQEIISASLGSDIIDWTFDNAFASTTFDKLILDGGDSIKPMQIIVAINGYEGTLTEAEIETYLRTIMSVAASPIVRLS